MACPNCGSDMQHVATSLRIFWCPRCGTLKEKGNDQAPKLVERVIQFCETLDENEPDDRDTIVTLHRLGILELITLPGQL